MLDVTLHADAAHGDTLRIGFDSHLALRPAFQFQRMFEENVVAIQNQFLKRAGPHMAWENTHKRIVLIGGDLHDDSVVLNVLPRAEQQILEGILGQAYETSDEQCALRRTIWPSA